MSHLHSREINAQTLFESDFGMEQQRGMHTVNSGGWVVWGGDGNQEWKWMKWRNLLWTGDGGIWKVVRQKTELDFSVSGVCRVFVSNMSFSTCSAQKLGQTLLLRSMWISVRKKFNSVDKLIKATNWVD